MTSEHPIELREGDIFRWSYREPGDDRAYGRYHCCSCFVIVDKSGRLRDTFWGSGSDNRSFGQDDLPRLKLTRLGNMADLEKASEHQADYYDDTDIVDLNHSNSSRGNFYLRKGAIRSLKKMLETARYKLEQSVSVERCAANRSEQLRAAITKIEAGDTTAYF
jgi:hypothetical protein